MSILMHATHRAESIRTPTNDERIAAWAVKYFGAGHHRRPSKPRVRIAPEPTRAQSPERAPADPARYPGEA